MNAVNLSQLAAEAAFNAGKILLLLNKLTFNICFDIELSSDCSGITSVGLQIAHVSLMITLFGRVYQRQKIYPCSTFKYFV